MEEKQLTFKELYSMAKSKPSPEKLFVREIAELTKRSEATVRMWAKGRQVPDALAKSLIAERVGVNEDTLFPQS